MAQSLLGHCTDERVNVRTPNGPRIYTICSVLS